MIYRMVSFPVIFSDP